jgi:hypothetical protein
LILNRICCGNFLAAKSKAFLTCVLQTNIKIMIIIIAQLEFLFENSQNNAIIAAIKKQPHEITSFAIKAAEKRILNSCQSPQKTKPN